MKIFEKIKIKPFYKYFAYYFLPVFVILLTSLIIITTTRANSKVQSLFKSEKVHVNLMKKVALSNLGSIFSDLLILANQPELKDMLKSNSFHSKKNLENAYLIFSKSKGMYDQIRFLDNNGMEKIRINYNDGKPVVVQDKFLQNKGNRYYFKDAFVLPENMIFVSPFDLNIEKGEIEKPLKPMIRFATSVLDHNNKKRGIVLLNYLGELMIKDITSIYKRQPGVLMILNSNGYWLKGEKVEDEWGFMFKDRKNVNMAKRYPLIWKEIDKNKNGQIRSNHGLFTFDTVIPLKTDALSSDGAGEAFKASKKVIKYDEYKWKIVTFVQENRIFSLKKEIYLNWGGGFIIVIILQFYICWLLARSRITKIKHEEMIQKSLEEKELLLKEIHHRVKNSLNMVYNMLNLQLYDSDDDKIEKIIKDIQSRILSIGTIHEKLYKSKDLININFEEYIRDLFEMLMGTMASDLNEISINYDFEFVDFHADKAITLGILLAELFTNSLKYAFAETDNCKIEISLKSISNSFEIIFSDNGKGLPEEFAIENSDSFGLKLVNILVEQLKGHLQYDNDNGARFILTFPK